MADKSNQPAGSPASRARAASAKLRAQQEAKAKRQSMLLQAGVIGAVVIVVVGITFAVLAANSGGGEKIEGAPPNVEADGIIVAGDPEAAVTLTLIEDFQCPACRQFEAQNKELLDTYAEDKEIRLEYRPIAFLDQASSTEYSSRALNAAACFVAKDPTDWRAFHQALYDNQPAEQTAGLTDDALISMAVDSGAEQSDVASCIKGRSYEKWVESTTKAALDLPVFEGTPTVLVNGEKVDSLTPEAIQAAVDAAK